MSDSQIVDFEQAEALGVSRQAFDEILDILGRHPSPDDLATLLAMWESNGRQQSLYGWLRGQHHTVHRDDYLYTGHSDNKAIAEPRIKDCLAIAKQLCLNSSFFIPHSSFTTGLLLYLVGNIGTEFADSEYARRCLHLVSEPMGAAGSDEDCQYIDMILSALRQASLLDATAGVGEGGLFCSLLRFVAPRGFDILAPREVRLDAFLFGEERGRRIAILPESQDDAFLLKLTEARLNCCFLGRTTQARILVDGFDFGPVAQYLE